MNKNRILIGAACAGILVASAAHADNHTITVNASVTGMCKFNAASSTVSLTLDPSATGIATQIASVIYRCTKGTAPAFVLRSGSSGSATGGNLVSGA